MSPPWFGELDLTDTLPLNDARDALEKWASELTVILNRAGNIRGDVTPAPLRRPSQRECVGPALE